MLTERRSVRVTFDCFELVRRLVPQRSSIAPRKFEPPRRILPRVPFRFPRHDRARHSSITTVGRAFPSGLAERASG